VLRIGRAGDNEVVVPDLSVSGRLAELHKLARGGYEIVDRLAGPSNRHAQSVLLILIMGACLTGVANAARNW
jgi:hypothetical protein